jgi:hypothetical protein
MQMRSKAHLVFKLLCRAVAAAHRGLRFFKTALPLLEVRQADWAAFLGHNTHPTEHCFAPASACAEVLCAEKKRNDGDQGTLGVLISLVAGCGRCCWWHGQEA